MGFQGEMKNQPNVPIPKCHKTHTQMQPESMAHLQIKTCNANGMGWLSSLSGFPFCHCFLASFEQESKCLGIVINWQKLASLLRPPHDGIVKLSNLNMRDMLSIQFDLGCGHEQSNEFGIQSPAFKIVLACPGQKLGIVFLQ